MMPDPTDSALSLEPAVAVASARTLHPIPRSEERLILGVVTAVGLVLLALAIYLKPDPRGYGTHEQLFLLPCGFYKVTGLPCPTCGMTTAYANMARLQLGPAFRAQPFGSLLFLLSTGSALGSLFCLAAGRQVLHRIEAMSWRWPAYFLVTAFILSWLAKAWMESGA